MTLVSGEVKVYTDKVVFIASIIFSGTVKKLFKNLGCEEGRVASTYLVPQGNHAGPNQ